MLHTCQRFAALLLIIQLFCFKPSLYAAPAITIVSSYNPIINSVTAVRNRDNSVSVNWIVEHEVGTRNYQLEKSVDGIVFTTIETITTAVNDGGRNVYDMIDWEAVRTDVFYRIKVVSLTGQVSYSGIVKVDVLQTEGSMAVYPNPVERKTIHVHFKNRPEGEYLLTLFNAAGRGVWKASVSVTNSSHVSSFYLGGISAGVYQFIITGNAGRNVQQIIIN